MASSKSKKLRQKLIREGRMDPSLNRSPFSSVDMRTRTTKTKKDHLYKAKNKSRGDFTGTGDSFFISIFLMYQNLLKQKFKRTMLYY